jgi:hypothetical protein
MAHEMKPPIAMSHARDYVNRIANQLVDAVIIEVPPGRGSSRRQLSKP